MTDDELLGRFESCTLRPDDFGHHEHVRLAWIHVTRYPVLEAVDRFARGLRRLTAHFGVPEKYHETITWAYLFLVHERVHRMGRAHTWQEFLRGNEDLLSWRDGILRRYYQDDTLSSGVARSVFVLPDRVGTTSKMPEPSSVARGASVPRG